jgi:hypothetical protein
MDNVKLFLFKVFFPVTMLLAGLTVIIFGVAKEQTIFFILGGVGLFVVGALTFLMMIRYEALPASLYKILLVVFIPAVLLMFWFSFNSINDPIKFENEYKRRSGLVKERLMHLRDAQEAFKSVNKRYTSDMDTLISFITDGELPLLKKINNTPALLRDSLPERELIKRGFIVIDTTYVKVMDSIFKKVYNFNPENLPYIPFSNPRQKFAMKADFINRGNVTVPVFEIVADKYIYMDGQKKQYIDQDKVISLQVGSLFEPIKDGNWE